jgi:hypothetical protein
MVAKCNFEKVRSSSSRGLISTNLHSAPPHPNTFTMPSTHNVEKPWDTDDIDKWKVR